VVELFGYFWFVAGISFGFVDVKFAVLFLVVAFWLGALMSIQTLVIDNWGFNLFKGSKSRLKLLAAALLENLGYRQATPWFRIRGLMKFMVGEKSWGKMTRKGFERHSEPDELEEDLDEAVVDDLAGDDLADDDREPVLRAASGAEGE
jgi:hypothetical protein